MGAIVATVASSSNSSSNSSIVDADNKLSSIVADGVDRPPGLSQFGKHASPVCLFGAKVFGVPFPEREVEGVKARFLARAQAEKHRAVLKPTPYAKHGLRSIGRKKVKPGGEGLSSETTPDRKPQ